MFLFRVLNGVLLYEERERRASDRGLVNIYGVFRPVATRRCDAYLYSVPQLTAQDRLTCPRTRAPGFTAGISVLNVSPERPSRKRLDRIAGVREERMPGFC